MWPSPKKKGRDGIRRSRRSLGSGHGRAMEAEGIPAFGPRANAAIIEASKVFSKNLMKKYGIPTAGYEVFSDPSEAASYIEKKGSFPIVVKADGLALGKGVLICQNLEEAKKALHEIMEDKVFGASGNQVVIEEFITGRRSPFWPSQTATV